MPVVALSPTFAIFVIARSMVGFALNGEWSLGSMLVAETWPARLRGRVISIDALDVVPRRLAGRRHHRARRRRLGLAYRRDGAGRDRTARDLRARHLPGIALLGARAGSQAAHLRETLSRGGRSARKTAPGSSRPTAVGIRQVFLPDMLPATLVALFVACCSTCIFGTVGAWMPLYLATEKHWSTAEYSLFYVFWGIVGILRPVRSQVGSPTRSAGGSAFMVTADRGRGLHDAWVYTENHLLLWMFGLAWSFGFLGFWGPSTMLTAEIFPTRIRGVANGVVWAIAYFVGFVLLPFVDGRTAAAHRIVRAVLPLHPRA